MGSGLPAGQRVRTAVRVEGIVQGVGFRPFVYSLATGLGLGGLVGNDSDGVFAEVEGPPAAVEAFLRSLARDAPPLARVERITTTAMRHLNDLIVGDDRVESAMLPVRDGVTLARKR